jgi:hypothetical protein
MPIHLLIFFDNSSDQCVINPSYNLAYTSFAFIAIGILPQYNLTNIRSCV